MISKYGAVFMLVLKLATALESSPDGTCGGVQQYTCAGADDGLPCCSSYGWCGNTDDHCGTGCQSGFGTCNETSLATGGPSTTLVTSIRISESTTATAEEPTLVDIEPTTSVADELTPTDVVSITSSVAVSTPASAVPTSLSGAGTQSCTCKSTVDNNPTCPTNDGACYTINGKTFSISCGDLANGDILGYAPVVSLSTCISTCAMIKGCVAVSYFKQGPPECALLSSYTGAASNTETGTKAVARLQGSTCT